MTTYIYFIRIFLYLVLCWLFGSDLVQDVFILAVPVCKENTFWNKRIEECDDCFTFCVPTVLQYMQVCKEECPHVYARLMHTTSTTQTPISTSTWQTIVPTVVDQVTSQQNETTSTSVVLSTNEIIQISVIGVCSLFAVTVFTLAVILIIRHIRRRKSRSTPTNPEETTSSLVGGSQETFSTPVEAQDGDNGSGSQELSSLASSQSQSLGSAEEVEPLNVAAGQGTSSLPQLASGVND